MQNWCAEIKIRAERRAGELLKDDPAYGRGKKSLTMSDLGIDHNQATRWQTIASLPEPDFEAHLAC
jgi:hypothetical protein